MDNQLPTIHLDPSGDLTLITEFEDSETETTFTRTYVASSQVLCLASPVWKVMFDPQGPWARQSSNTEGFKMYDDDPKALLILLDIAHLNFNRIPRTLTLEQLFQIAILCDKYDTVKLIQPWIKNWSHELQSRRPVNDPENLEWLFIAWSLGNEPIYETLFKKVVLKMNASGRSDFDRVEMKMGEFVPPGAIGKRCHLCDGSEGS